MSIRINDIAPDFTAQSTAGEIRFHDWLGGSYAIVFSHPRDFTPVCTTEFAAVAQLAAQWKKRSTKVIGVSVDSVTDHDKWKRDIESFGGAPAARGFSVRVLRTFPDFTLTLCPASLRTPARRAPCRGVSTP